MRLQSKGEKLYAKHFLISVTPGATLESRLGIAITKKVAPRSVDRNRVKRRIREIFRLYRTLLIKNLDIVVVARRDAHLCSFAQTKHEFLFPLKRGGYLKGELEI